MMNKNELEKFLISNGVNAGKVKNLLNNDSKANIDELSKIVDSLKNEKGKFINKEDIDDIIDNRFSAYLDKEFKNEKTTVQRSDLERIPYCDDDDGGNSDRPVYISKTNSLVGNQYLYKGDIIVGITKDELGTFDGYRGAIHYGTLAEKIVANALKLKLEPGSRDSTDASFETDDHVRVRVQIKSTNLKDDETRKVHRYISRDGGNTTSEFNNDEPEVFVLAQTYSMEHTFKPFEKYNDKKYIKFIKVRIVDIIRGPKIVRQALERKFNIHSPENIAAKRNIADEIKNSGRNTSYSAKGYTVSANGNLSIDRENIKRYSDKEVKYYKLIDLAKKELKKGNKVAAREYFKKANEILPKASVESYFNY